MASVSRVYCALRLPVLLVLPGLILGAGCSGSGKAQAVFEETIRSGTNYASYAISISAGSDAEPARQYVLSTITSDHFTNAIAAIRALGTDPPAEAADALREAFDSRRGALKLQAAAALARLGDGAALDWLQQEMAAETATPHVEAMTALAAAGRREALEPLLRKAMASEDPGTRNEVYAVLGEIRQEWATKLLLEGLDNEFGEERAQAIVSLGRTGDPAVAEAVEPFINRKGLVFASIEALGSLDHPDSVDALADMLTHDESLVRAYAGVAVWRLGEGDRAVEVLEPLVGDPDSRVRENLADQLGSVSSARATDLLVRLAADSDKAVRVAAVRSLVGRDGVGAALLQAAGDAEYEVATLALNGLAGMGGPDDLAVIKPLLDSDNAYLALSAAHAMMCIEARRGSAG